MKICWIALAGLFSVVLFGACSSGPHGPGCQGGGAACQAFQDCCSGTCNNGMCTGGGCNAPGVGCGGNGDCCTRLCYQNLCEACVSPGTPCNDDQNCCSLKCNNDICM
jgi:hypothetical protein